MDANLERARNHPRFIRQKYTVQGACQSERRAKLLEWRKRLRYDHVNHLRRLAENDWATDFEDEIGDSASKDLELNDVEMGWIAPYCKPPKFYKNQLMLSEWLIDVPSDLETEWLFLMCPEGKRCLIVASKGKTIAYTKSGYRVNTFPSILPGGNKSLSSNFSAGNYTILDCVYNVTSKTFYVLDVLCWRGHSVIDSETDFRFYWLQTKFEEIPEISSRSKENIYSFVPLISHPCSNENLFCEISSVLSFDPVPLDGILFYHKKSHYLHGISPLVGWLKPFMLPEMLNITVPELYAEKPKNYTCISDYLKVAFAKKNSHSRMDEEEIQEEIAIEGEVIHGDFAAEGEM